MPADVGFPAAAEWQAQDIGVFAVAVGEVAQLAVDTSLRQGNGADVLVLPSGSAKQIVLAPLQLLVDLPFESSKDIAETFVGYGSARGVSFAIVQRIASRFELRADVRGASPVLAQSPRQHYDVSFAAVLAAYLVEHP